MVTVEQLDASSPLSPFVTFDADGTPIGDIDMLGVNSDLTQLLPNSGVLVDSAFLSGGMLIDDVISPDGAPLLARETFASPDVTSAGLATITGQFARPGEVNYRILVAWGDDSFSYHHVTGATGDAFRAPDTFGAPGEDDGLFGDDVATLPEQADTDRNTARTFQFEHFYDPGNLPNPNDPADPILIRVFVQADPNIVAVDVFDTILDPTPPGTTSNEPNPNAPLVPVNQLLEFFPEDTSGTPMAVDLSGMPIPIEPGSLVSNNLLNRQFLLNEIFAEPLALAATSEQVEEFPQLGQTSTGLGARIDTLRGPTEPGALIEGIVEPSFNLLNVDLLVQPNDLTGGEPAIVDFQFEQVVTGEAELAGTSPTQDEVRRAGEFGFQTTNVTPVVFDLSVVEVPPITASVVAIFVFTSDVPALAFPETSTTIEAFAIGEGVQQEEVGVSIVASQADEQQTEERVVVLRVLRPTGLTVASKLTDPMELLAELTKLVAERFQVDEERVELRVNSFGGFDGQIEGEPGKEDKVRQLELKRNLSGGYDIVIITTTVDLKEDVLDDLPRRVFQRLPDGRYGIFLREAGQQELRRIMEVIIRDGRPADDNSNDQNGTPGENRPAVEEQAPTDEAADSCEDSELQDGQAGAAAYGADSIDRSPLNGPSVRTTAAAEFNPTHQEPFDAAWARWGQTAEESLTDSAQAMDVTGASMDGDEMAATEQAAEGTAHPLATSALLAGGAILAKLRQGRWKERVDETMARWEENQQEKADSRRLPR